MDENEINGDDVALALGQQALLILRLQKQVRTLQANAGQAGANIAPGTNGATEMEPVTA